MIYFLIIQTQNFFFINSYNLKMKFLENLERPINTYQLPINKMIPISKLKESKHVKFWDIIDPAVSWEFLIGIYLTIFKREKWNKNLNFLNNKESPFIIYKLKFNVK